MRIFPEYRGGINSFTFGLLAGFTDNETSHEFIIYCTPSNKHLFHSLSSNKKFSLRIMNDHYRLFSRIYHLIPWALKKRIPLTTINRLIFGKIAEIIDRECNIVYMPYMPPFLFPIPHAKQVMSFHDIQHAYYPEFFSTGQLRERLFLFSFWFQTIHYCQTSSAMMTEDVHRFFPDFQKNKIYCIPEGVNVRQFSQHRDTSKIIEKYKIPWGTKSFLFKPAQLWPHKNHLTILRALAYLKNTHGIIIPLVLTGAEYSGSSGIFEFIKKKGLNAQVRYLGIVPKEDIIDLYKAAKFLITAVLYESSSIPILEAAASGTPIIASDTPPNREMSKTIHMLLFPALNDQALGDVIRSAWHSPEENEARILHNHEAIKQYDWKEIAGKYLGMFEHAVKS